MANSYDISGKTILVTGANRGIGKCIVEKFIEAGAAKVYATARKIESLNPLVEECGDKVVALKLDVTEPETIVAAARKASDVDVVINNAGVLKVTNPLDAKAIETLNFEMDVNVYGLIRMAQAFAPVLKKNGGGVFAQLNSVASLKSFADFSTYCASKAAAYSITQALRDVLAAQGTYVLSVHPGPIETDMAKDAGFEGQGEPPEQVAEEMIRSLAKGEFHCFTDTMAKQFGEAYAGFASSIVESE